MSDEAFARRFYSDRAELRRARRPAPLAARRVHRRGALHAPLRALLPAAARARPTTSSRRCRRASTCSRASSRTPSRCGSRSRTSRSAAPGLSTRRRPRRAVRVEVRDPDYSPEMQGRLGEARGRDLEAAHGQVPLLVDRRATRSASARSTRTRCFHDSGAWYVVGADLDDEDDRARSASRASAATSASRRAASATSASPADFDVEQLPRPRRVAVRRRRRRGADRGRAATRPGGSSAPSATADRVEDGVFVTEYAEPAAARLAGCCARTAARSRSSPPSSGARSRESLRARARAPRGRAARARRRGAATRAEATGRAARPGRSRPERFAVLQALLAYLLAACGEDKRGRDPGRTSSSSASTIPPEELEEHLSLLNLVNFGGGCYAVYAELRRRRGPRRQGALRRHVPRAAAADAARGARDPARARVRRPDDRRRARTRRSTACARSSRRPSASSSSRRRPSRTSAAPRRTSSRRSPTAIREQPARRARVPEGGARRTPSTHLSSRTRSSAGCRTGTSTPGTAPRRRAQLPPRPHAQRDRCSAGLRAARGLRARTSSATPVAARIWYSPAGRALGGREGRDAARRRLGRRRAARSAARSGWSARSSRYRGEAVVLEPPELAPRVAERARDRTLAARARALSRADRAQPRRPAVERQRRA